MLTRSRTARRIALTIAALASVGAVTLAAVTSTTTALRPAGFMSITDREALSHILRLGLDAESTAVAGIAPGQLSMVIQEGLVYFRDQGAALAAADSAVTSARTALDRTERQAASGLLGSAPAGAVATARGQLNSAVAARDALLSQGFDVITENLSGAQIAALQRLASNRDRGVPIEYRVLERTPAQWAQLTQGIRAVVARRQAAVLDGAAPLPGENAALAAAEADPAVVAARIALGNSAPLEAVWSAALNNAR